MLLTPQQIAALRRILNDASTALAITTFGLDATPEQLQRLVDEGYIDEGQLLDLVRVAFTAGAEDGRQEVQQAFQFADKGRQLGFDDFLAKRLNQVPLSAPEKRAREIAATRAGMYCQGLGNRWSDQLQATIINADMDLANRTRGIIRDRVAVAVEERKTRGQLRSDLRQATQDWGRDWERIANTEMQTAHQEGVFESVVERHGMDEMYAKIPDPGACPKCRELYLENGKPMIRPMSWWAEQGTNYGRKQKDWRPVIGTIHPHCACQGTRCPKGWHFTADWEMVPPGGEDEEKSVSAGDLEKGGPYIGPRGGKWADAAHTVPWKEPNGRTGVIGVDPVAVRATVEQFLGEQKWHPRTGQMLNPDGYPKSHSIQMKAKDASGRDIGINVVLRPDSTLKDPRGVSGTHHLTGNATSLYRTIYLDVLPSQWDRKMLGDELRSVLAHEITHASDPSIGARSKGKGAQRAKASTKDLGAYYNKPEEITARLQQIYRELNTPAAAKEAKEYASLWADDPGDERASSYLVDHVMSWSETWKAIEEHLTPKNRKRILQAAARLMVRHVEGSSEPVEKAHKLHYRTTFAGLPISIENRKGSYRRWHDPHSGEEGKTFMSVPYGYINLPSADAVDGDKLDVFLGHDQKAPMVYIVRQLKAPEFKVTDELKVMLGFANRSEAERAYLAHYDTPDFHGDITEVPIETFRENLMAGKYKGKMIAKAVGDVSGQAYDGRWPNTTVGSGGMMVSPEKTRRKVEHIIDMTSLMDWMTDWSRREKQAGRKRIIIKPEQFDSHLGAFSLPNPPSKDPPDPTMLAAQSENSKRNKQRMEDFLDDKLGVKVSMRELHKWHP